MTRTLAVYISDGARGGASLCFHMLEGFFERVRGLLGTTAAADPVALTRCASVHTFGMRYALDVALVTRDGRVVASCRNLPAARIFSAPGAYYALERPSTGGPWPAVGTQARLVVENRRDGKAA